MARPATLITAEDSSDTDTYRYIEYSSFSRMLVAMLMFQDNDMQSDHVEAFIDGSIMFITTSEKETLAIQWYDGTAKNARYFHEVTANE